MRFWRHAAGKRRGKPAAAAQQVGAQAVALPLQFGSDVMGSLLEDMRDECGEYAPLWVTMKLEATTAELRALASRINGIAHAQRLDGCAGQRRLRVGHLHALLQRRHTGRLL